MKTSWVILEALSLIIIPNYENLKKETRIQILGEVFQSSSRPAPLVFCDGLC